MITPEGFRLEGGRAKMPFYPSVSDSLISQYHLTRKIRLWRTTTAVTNAIEGHRQLEHSEQSNFVCVGRHQHV